MGSIIGYVRPGAGLPPDVEEQASVLRSAGAASLFVERPLSKDADRPELRRALDALAGGDTLVVASLDRLARTPTELFYILEEIVKRGVALRSLRENFVLGGGGCAGVPVGTGAVVSGDAAAGTPQPAVSGDESFLRHLGMILDFERAMMKEWQRESIEAAKSRRGEGFARRRR